MHVSADYMSIQKLLGIFVYSKTISTNKYVCVQLPVNLYESGNYKKITYLVRAFFK